MLLTLPYEYVSTLFTCPTNRVGCVDFLFTIRVEISVTDYRKHNLPVPMDCKWQHPQGLAKSAVDCVSKDGKPAKNYADIALCVEQPECEILGALHYQTYNNTVGP